VAAPEQTDLLEQVRPLAHEIAVALIRQELAGFALSLNGNGSAPDAQVVLRARSNAQEATNGPRATPASPKSVEGQRAPCTRCGTRPRMKERTICRTCKSRADRERDTRRRAEADRDQEPPQRT
jgi:hypothetical protein